MNTTTIRFKSIPSSVTPTANPSAREPKFEDIVTVRRILTASAALMLFALMALGVSSAGASIPGNWYSSFESASRQSQRSGKPMFVVIAREGCGACTQMEQNLAASTSKRALSGAIKVRVESATNPNLTARYAAGGTPTTLVFAPGNYNAPVYQYTGVMDTSTIRQVGRSIDSLN